MSLDFSSVENMEMNNGNSNLGHIIFQLHKAHFYGENPS